MKYICTKGEGNKEEIFTFPGTVDHDAMAEVLGCIKNHTHGNWERVMRTPVSAGFVSDYGGCYGESVTLNLKSRTEDTALLRSQVT